MSPSEPRWTPPRLRALRVFATAHLCNTAVRESNSSVDLGDWDGDASLTCYWQTFRWLISQGLAIEGTAPRADRGWQLGGPWARLTDAGVAAVREHLPGLIP